MEILGGGEPTDCFSLFQKFKISRKAFFYIFFSKLYICINIYIAYIVNLPNGNSSYMPSQEIMPICEGKL